MFGEVRLGEADYTVIWKILLFMSKILCQISWKGPFVAYIKLVQDLRAMNVLATFQNDP